MIKKHGKLDILINNTSITPEYPQGVLSFEQLSLALLIQISQTNISVSLAT
ncbi:MAG: SDR family oxidoreductase [Myxacorys chilensis ATA2-1-KO14]|nr:SDR family oxidoreductase [Myxacorys chilensis ATA2-1-KO14]